MNFQMEFHSMTLRFDLEGDPKFLYTHVILCDGDDFYSSQLPERIIRPENIPDIGDHRTLEKIPPEHLWPKVENRITICPNPEDPNIYIKRPRLTGYDGTAKLSSWLLQEARICELLIDNIHKNVTRYFGCTVKNDRITGLCFEKHEETLEDRIRDGRSVDNKSCLRQIGEGVDHLHDLGIVHNDMGLDNVMFRDRNDDVPVIIDFDSSAIRGCSLPNKHRPLPDGIFTAEFANDALGLQMLQEEMLQEKILQEEMLQENFKMEGRDDNCVEG